MKKILVMILLLFFSCIYIYAERITFYAYGPGFFRTLINGPDNVGHASFKLEGYGMWGFGPADGKVIGGRGIVNDDSWARSIAEILFTTNISSEKARAVRFIADQWRSNPPNYNITTNDCVSFVMRIADEAGLRYHWATTQSPRAFVESLQQNNNDQQRYDRTMNILKGVQGILNHASDILNRFLE